MTRCSRKEYIPFGLLISTLFLLIATVVTSVGAASPPYLSADVTNNLKDSSKCPGPGWSDTIQWAIKSGDCSSPGGFTPVTCENAKATQIDPGQTVRAECELKALPPGNYKLFCLRAIWCQKEQVVPGEKTSLKAVALAGFSKRTASNTVEANPADSIYFYGSKTGGAVGSATYQWDFGDRMVYVGASGDTTHSYAEPKEYIATLKVTLGKETSTERVTVKVLQQPKAEAKAGLASDKATLKEIGAKPGELVYFDGLTSTSPDGKILDYEWAFGDNEGIVERTGKTSHSYLLPGEYIASLVVVTDKGGLSNRDTVKVKVGSLPGNKPPVADIKVGLTSGNTPASTLNVLYGQTVFFDGTKSTDEDGRIVSYSWYYDDGVTNSLTAEKTGKASYKYEIVPSLGIGQLSAPRKPLPYLLVTDDKGGISTAKAQLTLNPDPNNKNPKAVILLGTDPKNLAPAAELTVDETQRVYFDASKSTDEDGTIKAYEWRVAGPDSFQDLGYVFSRTLSPGTHEPHLYVIDDKGGYNEATVKITVNPKPTDEKKSGFTILFLPMDWGGGWDAFDSAADRQLGAIVDSLPLKDCPEKVLAVKIHKSCAVNMPADSNTCNAQLPKTESLIQNCASDSGETKYDYIIALTDKEICGENIAASIINTDIIYSRNGVEADGVVIHELGHRWGLADEYNDYCRCQKLTPRPPSIPNCLDASIGGGDPTFPEYAGYCAGGGATCSNGNPYKGNKNPVGGRCIMGAVIAEKPREFCAHCMEHLLKREELTCGGVNGGGDSVKPIINNPPLASLKVGFDFYDTSKEASALAGGGEMGFWASDSKDPDGTISSYKWDYGDGQKEETKDPVAHHRYASSGTYLASLVVVDDKGVASAQDTAKITVIKPPVTQAFAGTKQDDINYKEVTVKPGETVYFDGSRSSSEKGIKGFDWVYASAEQGQLLLDYLLNPSQTTTLDTDKSAKPSRSFTCNDKECDYSAILLIDEGEGIKKDDNLKDDIIVKVVRDPASSPIKAIAYVGAKKDDVKYSSVKVNYGEPLYYVDKSTSTNAITSRLWYYPEVNKNSKAVKDEVEEATGDLSGTHTFQLFIEDEKNQKDNTEVSFEVVSWAGNKPPVAAIKAYYYNYYKEGSSVSNINSETYDPKYLEPITIDADKTIHIKKQNGKILMFSGADSTDPDGKIIAYKWVEDGSDLGASTDKETFLDFANLGEHSIELSALDDKGGVGKESLKVIVEGSTEEGAGLDIFFAPSSWKDSDGAFDSFIDGVKDFRKLLAPNCPEKIRLTNAKKECPELQGDFLDDIDKSMLSILDCSNRLGKTFDIIVVVTSNQLTPGLEGLSAGVVPITLISSKSPTSQSIDTIAHESGHQLGLADEYYDSCRCVVKAPNCLDASIGGSDQAGGFGKQCAGGTECSKGAVCKGNLNSHGGRCIMSAAADISYEPREFCPRCASYLASLPQLKCN